MLGFYTLLAAIFRGDGNWGIKISTPSSFIPISKQVHPSLHPFPSCVGCVCFPLLHPLVYALCKVGGVREQTWLVMDNMITESHGVKQGIHADGGVSFCFLNCHSSVVTMEYGHRSGPTCLQVTSDRTSHCLCHDWSWRGQDRDSLPSKQARQGVAGEEPTTVATTPGPLCNGTCRLSFLRRAV